MYLMRVLFCKIHFSFICFCKPSTQFYSPSPLKLENRPHASPIQQHFPDDSSSLASVSTGNGNVGCEDRLSQNGLKSSLRKPTLELSVVEKKKVQWVDEVPGRQIAEIKEFESSEDEDTGNFQHVNNRRCVCTIL